MGTKPVKREWRQFPQSYTEIVTRFFENGRRTARLSDSTTRSIARSFCAKFRLFRSAVWEAAKNQDKDALELHNMLNQITLSIVVVRKANEVLKESEIVGLDIQIDPAIQFCEQQGQESRTRPIEHDMLT